jgi:hypothetical protein
MRWQFSLLPALAAALFAPTSHAENLIERPGAHPKYIVELEPHLGIDTRVGGFGLGFRATFPVADRAFVPSINNSVAVGVGLDLGWVDGCYVYDRRGYCYDNAWDFVLPVVMQWNFWFSRNWSAYTELGIAVANRAFGGQVIPVGAIGGRYLFSDHVGIVVRIGYPTVSLGVGFPL